MEAIELKNLDIYIGKIFFESMWKFEKCEILIKGKNFEDVSKFFEYNIGYRIRQ